MSPESAPARWHVWLGDCRDLMAALSPDSIDSIVTDPPYGIGILGHGWDRGVPGAEFWAEALRVAKPGAHLVAFSSPRTYHRLACAIEDAGWEIRDQLGWLCGTRMAKSLDIGKQIDRAGGDPDRALRFTEWMRTTGLSGSTLNRITGTQMGGHWLSRGSQPAIPTREMWGLIRPHCGDQIPDWVDELVERLEAEREVTGHKRVPDSRALRQPFAGPRWREGEPYRERVVEITAPATDEAIRWDGWGTGLRSSWEPICLARKPFSGSVASNVVRHGVGALNVRGCRFVGSDQTERWPANVMTEDSPEVATFLAANQRLFYAVPATALDRDEGLDSPNPHSTVKPTELMRWLVRLVTPPGGLVLDPFCGSGSTGKAAILEGARFFGVDIDPTSFEVAIKRVGAAAERAEAEQQLPRQLGLDTDPEAV